MLPARTTKDEEDARQAVDGARRATLAASRLALLEQELAAAQEDVIARRLDSFGSSLVDLLTDGLQQMVAEVLRTVEAETGIASADLYEAVVSDYDAMSRELVAQVVLETAQANLAAAAREFLSSTVRQACLEMFERSANELRQVLVARQAPNVEGIERVPVSAAVRRATTHRTRGAAEFTLAPTKNVDPDDMELGGIDFDLGPASAGSADNNPRLVHHTKGRPKQAVSARCLAQPGDRRALG